MRDDERRASLNPQSEIRRSAIPSRRPHRVVQRFSTLLLALALVPVFAQQPSTQSAQQQASRKSADPQPTPPLPPPRVKIEEYRERASRIIGAALTDDTAYRRLAWLTDRIGNRLSGSESLGPALEWAASQMRRDRLDDVHKGKVIVPHWVRGDQSLELVEPTLRRLAMPSLRNIVGPS